MSFSRLRADTPPQKGDPQKEVVELHPLPVPIGAAIPLLRPDNLPQPLRRGGVTQHDAPTLHRRGLRVRHHDDVVFTSFGCQKLARLLAVFFPGTPNEAVVILARPQLHGAHPEAGLRGQFRAHHADTIRRLRRQLRIGSPVVIHITGRRATHEHGSNTKTAEPPGHHYLREQMVRPQGRARAQSFFHGSAARRESKPRPVPFGGMKSGVMSIPSSSEKALGR